VRTTASILRDAIHGERIGEMHAALSWVRDAGIGVGSEVVQDSVRACFPELLKPTLTEALVAPLVTVRRAAIYTLAKVGLPGHLAILRGVFERYLERDPILLPNLIDEMCWLGVGDDYETLVARVRSHSSYLTRWSFFGTCASKPDHSVERRPNATAMASLRASCTELVDDPSHYVRAEALWALRGVDLALSYGTDLLRADKALRKERQRARRRWLADAPSLRFVHLTLRDYGVSKDYDLDQLDALAKSLSGESRHR
jgi:hypothetical protein